jgi:hypothetical protein
MKLHKILSLILVAALAITVGLVGCSPQPTNPAVVPVVELVEVVKLSIK